MPRAVVYGPIALGGLSFVHLETEQFCLQLVYLVRSLSKDTLQTREYHHLIAAYQQYLGISTQFFSIDPFAICYKPINSLITYLWTEMHKYDVRLVSDLFWIPKSRFTNDQSIMEVILTRQREHVGTSSALSTRMVTNANTVRLHLRCTFASDLVDPASNHIIESLYQANTPRTTPQK